MSVHDPRTLVVYGVPAKMALYTATGTPLGKTFVLTALNRDSFEPALRQALIAFVKGDATLQGARFVFIHNASDLSAAVKSAPYTHVVYYGHALEGVNALLPKAGNRITVAQLTQALAGTPVAHLDLLGCQSASMAAELATLLPRLRIGYLRSKRIDNVECDPRTVQVIRMTIDPQAIFHFGGPVP